MPQQYQQGGPSPRDEGLDPRIQQINSIAYGAVDLRMRNYHREAVDEAWRGIRLAGLNSVDDIISLQASELAAKIPKENHSAAGKCLWIIALQTNHLPDGARKLIAFDIACRASHLDICHYDGMRTTVHFLGFNFIHGLSRDFPDKAEHAAELLDELRWVGSLLERHLKDTYGVKQGVVPPEINRERGPRREACAWALESAARVAWWTAAFAAKCDNALPAQDIAALQAKAEKYCLGVLAANGYSGSPDSFNPQVLKGGIPDGARRRMAAAFQILASVASDQGNALRSERLAAGAKDFYRGTEPEGRGFQRWAHPLPAKKTAEPPLRSGEPESNTAAVSAQNGSGAQANQSATKGLLAVDAGITWLEFQVFYSEQVKTPLPASALDKVSDAWVKLVEHGFTPESDLLKQVKEAWIDRQLFTLSHPDLRKVFLLHAEERSQSFQANEKDIIELVRTMQTARYLARRPGLDKAQRHEFEKLGRKLELQGRDLSHTFNQRGFFGALHDIFAPVFQ